MIYCVRLVISASSSASPGGSPLTYGPTILDSADPTYAVQAFVTSPLGAQGVVTVLVAGANAAAAVVNARARLLIEFPAPWGYELNQDLVPGATSAFPVITQQSGDGIQYMAEITQKAATSAAAATAALLTYAAYLAPGATATALSATPLGHG